jgi:hypothetical protein
MTVDDTSEIVVLQRIRNRIIEYLEAAAVPDNWSAAFSTPVELIEQWEDWAQAAWLSHFRPPVFTTEEVEAMRRFGVAWDRAANALVGGHARIDELFPLEEWRNLAAAARMTLQVFVVRGRFSEDEESTS